MKLYCIEVTRELEELYVFHVTLEIEASRQDILDIIMLEDINYDDDYGKFKFYQVK